MEREKKGGSKKRLCIVMGGHFTATIGGAQYQAQCILDELVSRGEFEIYYLARTLDPSYKPEGYAIRQIGVSGNIARYGFIFDSYSLSRALEDIRPDIVYQRGLKPYTGICARYGSRNRCRFVFHVAHDYDVLPLPLKPVSRRLPLDFIEKKMGEYGLRRAHCVITQSQAQSDLLRRHYGREATMVIPNLHPAPTEIIAKENFPVKVVWVANFKPMKRPEIFVRLAENLQDLKGVEFIMIGRAGDPKLYAGLHERIARLPNLRYLGERSIDEVNRFLAESHIFVNTSLAEGFPNTFIQAWMRKVPVVSLTVNIDGVLDDGSVGLHGRTYEGLEEAVSKLVKNSELRTLMGDRAQQHAFEHHSLNNVEKIIALMRA